MKFNEFEKLHKKIRVKSRNLEEADFMFVPLSKLGCLIMPEIKFVKDWKNAVEAYKKGEITLEERKQRFSEIRQERYDRTQAPSTDFTPEIRAVVENFEQWVADIFENPIESKPLEVKDGKVLLEGTVSHNSLCDDLEKLASHAELGIYASEYFGHLESASEGRCCSFFIRYYPQREKLLRNDEIRFYIDENNPVMQKLLACDYFEYKRKMLGDPEHAKDNIPKPVLDFIEQVVDPLTMNVQTILNWEKFDAEFNHWAAIPGGLPYFLISGLKIGKNNPLYEHLDEIGRLFPNATIFDEDNNVLRVAKANLNKDEGKDIIE